MKKALTFLALLVGIIGMAQVLKKPTAAYGTGTASKIVYPKDTPVTIHWDTISSRGPHWAHLSLSGDPGLKVWRIGDWQFYPKSPEYIIAEQIEALNRRLDSLSHPLGESGAGFRKTTITWPGILINDH